MSDLNRLADYVVGLRRTDLPSEAFPMAKLAMLNLFGCLVAGSDSQLNPSRAALLSYLDSIGSRAAATVYFSGRRAASMHAAHVNAASAMTSHGDDFSARSRTHASAVLLSTALAAGESAGRSGSEILLAFIAGWEVAARLGDALKPGVPDRGLHHVSPTHTPAAAAVAARLLGLDRDRTAQSIALACDGGTGLIAQAPTQASTLRTPLGTSIAIYSAEMAARGLGASPEALTAFLGAYAGTSDPAALTAGLGTSCALVESGFQLKPFHFSTGVFGTIRAIQAMRAEHRFSAAEVVAVDCLVSPGLESVYGFLVPANQTEAHFSIGLAVALALCRDEWGFADVATVPNPDPLVRSSLEKVRLVRREGTEHLRALTAEATRTQIVVRLSDGRELVSWSLLDPPISDPVAGDPVVRTLFRRRAIPALGAERAAAIEHSVARIDEDGGLDRLLLTVGNPVPRGRGNDSDR